MRGTSKHCFSQTFLRSIATAREVTSQSTQCIIASHMCALRVYILYIYIYIPIFNNIFPCRNLMIMPLAFTRQEAISALAVDNLQVSVLKTSRAFGCEDYLSPSNAHGESFIHCALLHTCMRAKHHYNRSFRL